MIATPERTYDDRAGPARFAALALALAAVPMTVASVREPVAALTLLGLAAVVFVCILRAEIAVLALVAIGPLESAIHISALPQLTATKILGAICFASFLLWSAASSRRLLVDKSHVIVLLLLVVALYATLGAEDPDRGLNVTLRYTSFVVLYFVLTQFIGESAFQRRLAWVLSISAGVAGLLAVHNFVGGGSYIAKVPGGDPNDTAYALATTLPLTLWLLRRRPLSRPVVLLLIGLIAAGVALSFSRGALVGLAAGLLWYVMTERRQIPYVILAALAAVAVTFAFVRANPERVEVGLTMKRHVAAENIDRRLEAWRGAVNLALEHPLGVGPGNFPLHYFEATGRPPSSSETIVVHNAYLDVAAELGVLGFVFFVAFVVGSFARASIAVRARAGPRGFAAAVQTSFVIAAVGALTLSEQYFAPIWVFGALATALWAEARGRASQSG